MIPLETASGTLVVRVDGTHDNIDKRIDRGCTGPETRFPVGLSADFQGFIKAASVCLTRSLS